MKMIIIAAAVILLISPQYARAICLGNCQQEETAVVGEEKAGQAGHGSIGYMADSVRHREKSHDTRDVKNSVMGDVNIHVGHKRMDVMIDKGSSNNSVNASVSSTIILGDMKQ